MLSASFESALFVGFACASALETSAPETSLVCAPRRLTYSKSISSHRLALALDLGRQPRSAEIRNRKPAQ